MKKPLDDIEVTAKDSFIDGNDFQNEDHIMLFSSNLLMFSDRWKTQF